jgi:glycosyltransferase involved in cell wall biosynthesis
MKLSIITPFRNIQDHTERLYSWLQSDSLDGVEIILVNDNIDTPIPTQLRKILIEAPTIKLIQGNFGGPGKARNAGLNICTGEWIGFWDSDDLPNPSEYISMLNEAIESRSKIAIGNYKAVNERDTSNEEKRKIKRNQLVEIYLNVGLWRMCFQSSLLGAVRFAPLKMAEDQLFFASINPEESDIYYSDRYVYTYFYGSFGHLTKDKNAVKDLKAANKLLLEIIKNVGSQRNILVMFFKQRVTMILRGNLFEKVWSIFTMPRSIWTLKPKISMVIYALLFTIKRTLGK